MQKGKVFVGHMIFRKQVLGRATRTGSGGNAADAERCAAFPPSTPLRLAALEELDQIALLTWRQTEAETGVVVVGHIQERRETAVVEEATL